MPKYSNTPEFSVAHTFVVQIVELDDCEDPTNPIQLRISKDHATVVRDVPNEEDDPEPLTDRLAEIITEAVCGWLDDVKENMAADGGSDA
jgi:hypothetical protein